MIRVEYERTRPIPQRKIKAVKELQEYLKSYRYLLLVSITGVTAPVLHETRNILRERGSILKVIKNKIFLKAIESLGVNGLKDLASFLVGQNASIFTNENPFEVKLYLDKKKIYREARAGDIATNPIVIPAGNTGIPPGPMISLFNKLKIPMRIQEGSIWVTSDTVVAKPGDVISPELAELLTKLGIKPIESSVKVKAIYLDGRVIKAEDIELDPEKYRGDIANAYISALNLAINAGIPLPETLEFSIKKAHICALSLAINAGVLTIETAPYILAKAQAIATYLLEEVKRKHPEIS